MRRLAVFIDYQNVYNLARRAFGEVGDPAPVGQVVPLQVGLLLEARRNDTYGGTQHETRLSQVRAYRGMPDGALDPKGHGAATRQLARWQRHEEVVAFSHPIAYPQGWGDPRQRARLMRSGERPREKGIDVQIAVDLVLGAVRDEFDVAVLFSADSDLLPALRAVAEVGAHVEVAAWSPPHRRATRIPSATIRTGDGRRRSLWCHFLDEDDFEACRDSEDYNRPGSGAT